MAEPVRVKPIHAPMAQVFIKGQTRQAVMSQGSLRAFLKYPCDANVIGTGELTFACWRKRTISNPMYGELVALPGMSTGARRMAGSQPAYKTRGMGVTDIFAAAQVTRDGKKWGAGYKPLPVGEWRHFAITRGPSGIRVYIDGVRVSSQGRNLDSGFPAKGTITFAPQGALDDAVLVRREFSAVEIGELMQRKTPPDVIEGVAAVWDFDGSVVARYHAAPDADGCSLFWRTGKRLNIFRADGPTQIEFNAVNWQPAATNAVFHFRVETLGKQVLLDRRRDVQLPAAGQRVWTEAIPPGTNGIFYASVELLDKAGAKLDGATFRFVRTIAPDVNTITRDTSFRTGVVEAGTYHWPEIGMKHVVTRSTSWGRRKHHPDKPIDWSDFDAEVECAQRNGVELVFFTAHIPAFEATDDKGGEGGTPKNWDRQRAFIEEALARYRGRVRYIEVLNEPYHVYPPEAVAQFARVYREAIDKVAPETRLIVPLGEPNAWAARLIQQTVDVADIYQVHSYGNFNNKRHPVYGADEGRLLELRRMIEQAGGKQEIWNTEAGVISPFGVHEDGRPWTPQEVRREREIEGTKASRVPGRAQSEYDVANNVTRGLVADAAGGVTVGCYFQHHMLTHGDRYPSLQMVAMGTFAGLITGSEYIGRLDLGTPEIRAYQFRKGKEAILAVWTTLGSPRKTYVNCSVPEVTFVDLWGTPTPAATIAGVLKVEATPVARYIRVPGHKVTHSVPVAALYPPEYLMAGRTDTMRVVLSNPFNGDLRGAARLELPAGVRATPSGWSFALRGKGTVREETVRVEVEPGFYHTSAPGILHVKTDSSELGTMQIQGLFSTRKAVVCRHVPAELVIDGDLDEWSDITPLNIGAEDQVAIGSTRPPGNPDPNLHFDWEGPDDLSAVVYLSYDKTNLYLGVDVTDGGLQYNENRNGHPYQGDCLELFLEIPTSSGNPTARAKPLYQLMFVPWTEDHPSASWKVSQPAHTLLTGVRGVSKRTPRGWTLEVSLPFANLRGWVPKSGDTMGLNVAVDDSDGPEDVVRRGRRKTQLMWTGDAAAFADPDGYGKVVFE